ncbi:MAG TPA: hypothetical protein VGO91_00310 [Pyrinomonadaceae bacterium]|jgi:hypothetical protein|nr:hypothetical protein [Pyrinomonadaceae bacterium]
MAKDLTEDQFNQLIQALQTASTHEVQTAIASKSSFVGWVEQLGLNVLARQIANLTMPLWDALWDAITHVVENVGDYIGDAIDALLDMF